jgi:hypothetical protein
MRTFRWLGIAAALLLNAASAQAGVVLNPGSGNTSLSVRADDGIFPFSSFTLDQFESIPFPFPFSDSHTAFDGAASASSTYQLSEAGFEITFEHTRAGNNSASGEAQSYGQIFFSVDADAFYDFSGAYTAIDPEGRHVILGASLYDMTLGGVQIFESWQDTYGTTPNENFILGETGGDSNDLSGSPSGPLIAGHEYRVYYGALIADRPLPAVQTATASGFVRFAIVPEPGTAGLLLAGLIALASHARVARR